jgi:hypothetical protein
MAEQPALNRSYVISYAANDRNFAVVGIRLDPRVAGYRVPEDLSPHPDSKRYPNHVFTGSQPSNGDERVTHVYEILPSPWVPFTRYDDDLGPIQGRRRAVKNESQQADLTSSTKISYEGRDGSAIVSNEIEETWSIKTDEDGNSLFPLKDRDFYDASRGAVQERRQLFVPTGEEEGTLENVNGVITQTSYEPYNEFLSVKVVQTYKVDGPQLVGNVTDEAKQLVTVTTQRKGSDGYVPPSPSATKTVEVTREDAESLIERVVDTPEVFSAQAYRKTKEDLTPQKFKAAQEDQVFEQTIEGTANPNIVLATGEFVKSEEQVNKFTKRVSVTSRSITSAVTLLEKVLTPQGQIANRILTLASVDQSFVPSATMIDASVEALGDGRTVKTEVTVPNVFNARTLSAAKPDVIPEQFQATNPILTTQEIVAQSSVSMPSLGSTDLEKREERIGEFTVRKTSATRSITFPTLRGQEYDPSTNIIIKFNEKIVPSGSSLGRPATIVDPISQDFDLVKEFDLASIQSELSSILFEFPTRSSLSLPPVLKGVTVIYNGSEENASYQGIGGVNQFLGSGSISDSASATASASAKADISIEMEDVFASNIPTTSFVFFLKYPVTLNKILAKVGAQQWPVFKPKSHTIVASGESKSVRVSASGSWSSSAVPKSAAAGEEGITTFQFTKQSGFGSGYSLSNNVSIVNIPSCLHGNIGVQEQGSNTYSGEATINFNWGNLGIFPNTSKSVEAKAKYYADLGATTPTDIPRAGKYLIDSRVEIYQYGFARVYAEVLDASIFA